MFYYFLFFNIKNVYINIFAMQNWRKQNTSQHIIDIVPVVKLPSVFKTPTGRRLRRYAEWGKSPTELHQMKSQLGQRVVGTAQRIPSTWSKHTSRDCIVWDREEKEYYAVGFSRGGIFHLCQPPLDALAAPAGLSRALYAAVRYHRPVVEPTLTRRILRIRDHATVLTITKKKGNASGKMTHQPKEPLQSEGVKRADT